jgi:hypothetical protein
MATIEYAGNWRARATSTDQGKRAAVGFPITASSTAEAKQFAARMVLELLPGWTVGSVSLFDITTTPFEVDVWTLRRHERQPRRKK